MKSMALYGERKVFYDTKTTCFGIVETTKSGTDKQSVPLFVITIAASVINAAAHNIEQFRGDGLLTTLIVLQVKLT